MKKSKPLPTVSILMCTYGDERYISKAIKSVLKQTYKNWEFIIVNDKSNDKSEKIIFSLLKSDHRLIYIKNKKNIGTTQSLNKAAKKAKGAYIARIDSDDVWIDKTKLKRQVEYLRLHQKYALVGSWAEAIDEDGKSLYELKYPSKDNEIRKVMLKQNCFVHSSVLIRKDDLKSVGYYNSVNETAQDYELWLELGKRRKLSNIPKILVQYRINSQGTSETKRIIQIDETIHAIVKNKHYYPGFLASWFLWNIRKLYPSWFRGKFSVKLQDNIRSFFNKI
jgi:glycosyltransferase involved in cell wall biosynthesis